MDVLAAGAQRARARSAERSASCRHQQRNRSRGPSFRGWNWGTCVTLLAQARLVCVDFLNVVRSTTSRPKPIDAGSE
eukprot:496822-Prymnesium_polylepis.1